MSILLSPAERRALKRAVGLLDLNWTRFAASVAIGSLGLGSALGLSTVAAWMIARASQVPDVVALGVAPVAVRLFGISRSVLRYCERLLSHDTALRGMSALRAHLYERLATSRADTVVGLRRGDVLARVGADVDAVGDLVVRSYLPMAVAACVGSATSIGMALIHPASGLILAACLLLAGMVGPLVTARAARASELARQGHATDLSAIVLTALEGGDELSVSGRLPRLMDELAGLEARPSSAPGRGARPPPRPPGRHGSGGRRSSSGRRSGGDHRRSGPGVARGHRPRTAGRLRSHLGAGARHRPAGHLRGGGRTHRRAH